MLKSTLSSINSIVSISLDNKVPSKKVTSDHSKGFVPLSRSGLSYGIDTLPSSDALVPGLAGHM